MGNVIKGNRYRLVDNRAFDLPLPLKFELLKADDLIALYEISTDENVSYRIVTKHKENMITPINRPVDISDIYYLFSSRVFQNCTPYTYPELKLVGLEKYSVYDIIRKTRGITPFDTYWVRFDGDNCDYDTALDTWNKLMSSGSVSEPPEHPVSSSVRNSEKTIQPEHVAEVREKETDSYDKSHVNDILNQHKIDVEEKLSREKSIISENNSSEHFANNTMSIDEIDALLMKSGLDGGFDKLEHKKEKTQSSGGNMSQEDIEKMLAAVSAPAAESEPAPAEEPKSSGGNMSQEDIEKMLAAVSAPAAESQPAPAEEPKSSGGNMSQEDIEKMLAAVSAPAAESEPAPAEEPQSGGGKMSQEDIEALLNGMKEDAAK